MTHPGAVVRCALEGCTNTWDSRQHAPSKLYCSRPCSTRQQNIDRAAAHGPIVRTCEYAECGEPFTVTCNSARTRFCCISHGALAFRASQRVAVKAAIKRYGKAYCKHCGKGILGRPPKDAGPRYCNAACKDAAEALPVKRGDVPRRDPYAAVCCHCGRSPSNEPLLLSDTELRALRPLPRCTFCRGPVWVEPFETTAHRVSEVPAGRTARPNPGWGYYHEPVGEVAG